MDFDFSTYYKSLTISNRMDEEMIVDKAIENYVIPESVRYDIHGGAYRGVIKSNTGRYYYFSMSPSQGLFNMMEADSPDKLHEVGRMFKTCSLGCDLAKADGAGADGGSGGFNTVSEEENIEHQKELTTDVHPGSATHVTPDDPTSGRMWHEQEIPAMTKSWNAESLLVGLNDNLRKSTSQLLPSISPQERKFLTEVLGRTPEQISRGNTKMNPTQKVMYQQWLTKSMKSNMDGLSKWFKK